MPRKKTPNPILEVEELEVAPETKIEVAVEESEAKKNFRTLIETYKRLNPDKYESKKDSFEKQLNSL